MHCELLFSLERYAAQNSVQQGGGSGATEAYAVGTPQGDARATTPWVGARLGAPGCAGEKKAFSAAYQWPILGPAALDPTLTSVIRTSSWQCGHLVLTVFSSRCSRSRSLSHINLKQRGQDLTFVISNPLMITRPVALER